MQDINGVLNMNEDVNEITVDKDGKPSRMNQPYQQLRVLKDIYKGKGIEVLNMYWRSERWYTFRRQSV